jgi:hypothetical protein
LARYAAVFRGDFWSKIANRREMSEQDLVAIAQLEEKLDATLQVVSKLVTALDSMRSGDPQFIFEMDLVKHSLCEIGYFENKPLEE